MEALTAFGVNWKLLLIQGVNFAVLLLLLYRFLYKPMFALLERRQGVIAKGLADAKDAAREREDIEKEKSAILAHAREDGGRLMDELRKQAIETEREIVRVAHEKSAALLADADVRAKAEREHFLRESEKEVARMAVLSAEKILRAHK